MNASTLVQKVWNFCHTLKGDLYEGLLQKNAEDTKSGAGQYFTPRALIEAMVACVRREPMKTIADPACGTGGIFLGTYNWLTRPSAKLDRRAKAFLRDNTVAYNLAQEISVEDLSKSSGVSKPTIAKYPDYLEVAFQSKRMRRCSRRCAKTTRPSVT